MSQFSFWWAMLRTRRLYWGLIKHLDQMAYDTATTIFEYLTAKNPDLVYLDQKHATLTKNPHWFKPTHVRPWEEFSFQTIEGLFGGKLMEECHRERVLIYPLPRLDPETECVENGEDSTRDILTRWTRVMVNVALHEIVDAFDPVFWVPTSRADTDRVTPATNETIAANTAAVERGRPTRRFPSQVKGQAKGNGLRCGLTVQASRLDPGPGRRTDGARQINSRVRLNPAASGRARNW